MNGQLKLLRDCDQYTAASCTIELCHYQARDTCPVPKHFHLVQGILSRCRIEHQNNVVWRSCIKLFQDSADLFELFHQHLLVLQTSCCVQQQHIGAGFLGRF